MEFDTYVFACLATAAQNAGGYSSASISKTSAYEAFLAGQEYLGNNNVPDSGRVCFCSYAFANLIKLDPAFTKAGDDSQAMVIKGVFGDVDGCKMVRVPSSRLPAGCAFIITHPIAAVAPKQLEDYKIHDNPPGISGWLVEGRIIYDSFVLNEKVKAIYYHGAQAKLRNMVIQTSATASGKSTIGLVNPNSKPSTSSWYYDTAATAAGLEPVTYGTAITTGNWTALSNPYTEITPSSGHKYVRVVEVNTADSKHVAFGDAILNIG